MTSRRAYSSRRSGRSSSIGAPAYDWRKAEAKLNSLPQFTTTIDGVDIHFIHVRSKHPNALPLIMTHGWPGSVLELLKTVGPLTDPTAHGGSPEDAFDLVHAVVAGLRLLRQADGHRLGHGPHCAGLGGADEAPRLRTTTSPRAATGALPSRTRWRRQAPAGLLGIHVNLPAVVPPEIAAVLAAGGPAPAGLDATRNARRSTRSAWPPRWGTDPTPR